MKSTIFSKLLLTKTEKDGVAGVNLRCGGGLKSHPPASGMQTWALLQKKTTTTIHKREKEGVAREISPRKCKSELDHDRSGMGCVFFAIFS
jgi:hypothetical protein